MKFGKFLPMVIFLLSGAAQAAILDLTIDPLTKTVLPGESFTIDIRGGLDPLSGITNIDAGGLLLSFDSGVVNLISVAYGSPFLDLLTTFDNATGSAALVFGNFGNLADPASFLIATLSMTAGNPPSSPSTLLGLSADPSNPFVWEFINEIAVDDIAFTDATVNIGVVPLPGAAWLMLTALGMLGFKLWPGVRVRNLTA